MQISNQMYRYQKNCLGRQIWGRCIGKVWCVAFKSQLSQNTQSL